MHKIRQTFRFLFHVISFTAFLAVMSGCGSKESRNAGELRTIEEKNKDFIRIYTDDFWNKQNIAAFEKYYTADLIMHFADGDMNSKQYKGLCQAYFSAFPDLNITTNDLIAEGDKVTKIWTSDCTHLGEFMGIPATGKRIMIKGIEVFRIENEKIMEVWVSMDNLGMMQQLGVMPPMSE